ncbi:hypothetical protein SDC9_121738 [bioreactor metagenome]|uniref:Uncharacterized protein n=1 Tax=bioreactor metagenome TaxID=1076179 RepID=A0A645CCT1_9ZZZZ
MLLSSPALIKMFILSVTELDGLKTVEVLAC